MIMSVLCTRSITGVGDDVNTVCVSPPPPLHLLLFYFCSSSIISEPFLSVKMTGIIINLKGLK